MKLKVLMVGPARDVKGGMTSVVDNYYEYGLDKSVNLKYIESSNDKNIISKILKEITGYNEFKIDIKKYDIVHIHMASRRSTFRKCKYILEANKYNKKIILHIHGAEFKVFFENECSEKKKQYIKKCLNMCDKVIVLSEEWKDYFKKIVNENKIVVIYNAIKLPKKFDKNTDTQQLLFLGRIGKRKGIYDLLDVVQQLIPKYNNIKLIIGGDGEIEKIKKIINEKKITSNVKVLGWINGEEKERLLRESSFYILPSYNEGMPMSLLEGMAYSNIPISTNVGGIPRIINDEINGFIINPGDKKKLKHILDNLLKEENKIKRKEISEKARSTIENKFDMEINIQKIIKLYNDMM